ncbi:MFS transporter [Aneurinibacillus thermoaerophilus]|uniref:CynX/NimT family MFS transporter n=1 Tax=Aneurinibacillus thermoaerophilus TaxID=143495 RepID=UPI002E215595|nr:MFS transporter [Aneurinibacillus thermoaerophilus]MED0765559.1 MFS transporter [Aneurinibacillus thermoaerophilus]
MSSHHQAIEKHFQESDEPSRSSAGILLLILGIIFIGMNLRAPLTSVGPLVGMIRDDLGISNTLAGMLTTLPLLAFAFVSPFAPKLARRFGINAVVLASLPILTLGIILRSVSGIGTLFLGTALLGFAISICNVLLPSLIKQEFPLRIGFMTGIYSVAMNLCGAIASGISIPLSTDFGLGWKVVLGCWAIPAFLSLLVWLPQARNRHKQMIAVKSDRKNEPVNVWRSRLAWKVTIFMGLQSLMFYIIVAWMPEILIERGLSASSSGWMLFLLQFALLPFTFIIPVIAGRMSNQRLLVIITFLLFVVGYLGLLFGGNLLIPVWAILIGIGGGCAFSLSMMFFSLRTQNVHQAAELSGMAQSVGYLLAAIGPTLFGLLHDMTHSWTLPLFIMVVASALLLIVGFGAGSNQYVTSKEKN